MALEDLTGSTVYIDSLVVTNPDGLTDQKSEGDNHIRGIKNVLKNTMPYVAGPISASDGDLSACTNFQETLSATTTEVTLATGATFNFTDVSSFKINGTAVTTTAAELNKLAGSTPTAAEINTLSGVTSSIQNQIDSKADISQLVTNGDSHDHSGGDGAQIPVGGIASNAITAAKINHTITRTSTSVANGAYWTPAAGIYSWVAEAALIQQTNVAGTWYAAGSGIASGGFITDGTDIRLFNSSGALRWIYYAYQA